MDIALTTRWNAGRHIRGEEMIEEILNLGFSSVELGYDTRLDLIEGVQKMVNDQSVKVNSVHNFCPLPMGAARGHPELYTFAADEVRVRQNALQHTANTIQFAASIGAKVAVTHCGYVKMRRRTEDLFPLLSKYGLYSPQYEKARMKLQVQREKKGPKYVARIKDCLERLLPVLEEYKVILAMENLPTWEACPNEVEVEELIMEFDSPYIKAWHDMGHAQIRENLGFISHEKWLQRLQDHTAGMHIHDVKEPVFDHQMPSQGSIDFKRFQWFVDKDIVRVIEPTPRTSAEDIAMGYKHLKEVWMDNKITEEDAK